MGEIIRICLVGLLVGILARFFYPGTIPMGFVASVLLGMGGSVVGGLVPRLFKPQSANSPFAPAGFFGSILGAMLLILLGRMMF